MNVCNGQESRRPPCTAVWQCMPPEDDGAVGGRVQAARRSRWRVGTAAAGTFVQLLPSSFGRELCAVVARDE